MDRWEIYVIGFTAQLLFTARLINQWLVSEKHRKVLTPRLFWKFSLLGSMLLFIYGYLRHDLAIMLGQGLTYFLYIRNMDLQGEWKRTPMLLRVLILLFPGILVIYYFNNNVYDLDRLFSREVMPGWLLLLGSVAQVIFTLRFFYQWAYSEKRNRSLLPKGFWTLSLSGSVLILLYAILRKDPVLLIGHLAGSIIYTRNLLLNNESDT